MATYDYGFQVITSGVDDTNTRVLVTKQYIHYRGKKPKTIHELIKGVILKGSIQIAFRRHYE